MAKVRSSDEGLDEAGYNGQSCQWRMWGKITINCVERTEEENRGKMKVKVK